MATDPEKKNAAIDVGHHDQVDDTPVFNPKAVGKETAHEAAERGRLATDMCAILPRVMVSSLPST